LNRHWVPRAKEEDSKDVYDIYRLNLVVYRDQFFLPLREQVFEAMMNLITRQRNGEGVSTQLIRGITDCFVALGLDQSDEANDEAGGPHGQLVVYKEYFEKDFLLRTNEYYQNESAAFLQDNQVTEYMKKALARLEQESRRVQAYLHESTRDALAKQCEDALIEAHKERLHAEFQPLLEAEKTEDLRRMYDLSTRINDLVPLRELLEKHVVEQGNAAISRIENPENPDVKAFVDCLLTVHQKYTDMVQRAFAQDATFVAAMDRACKKFVNTNAVTKAAKSTTKSPELLAKYCHALLKKGSKIAEGNDVESLLDGIMTVFQYLEDSDVYQKHYSKLLAQRLVNGTSESDDYESSMISKLKQKCGSEWTQKPQIMFKDIGLSRDLLKKFKEGQLSKPCLKDFGVQVLQTNSWPFSQKAENSQVTLPRELKLCIDKFEIFYQGQHQAKKLNWLFNLGGGELKTHYTIDPKKKTPLSYTLQCYTFQMAVLMQYNDAISYTEQELLANTQISESAMAPVLEILLKSKLLKKTGENYVLNADFKNKKLRVNLKVPTKRQTDGEREEVMDTVNKDRTMVVQAVIVRIMKMRKIMKHNQLLTEAIKQLEGRFVPKVPMLKKNVEILIEKGYIERDAEDRSNLRYLA